MGNIGHEFFLVVLGTGNFAGHVGNSSPQIADFIFAIQLKFIMHIAGSILFGCFRNLSNGKVNQLGKKNQNNQGQQEQNEQHNIGNVQQTVAGCRQVTHRVVDDHVALYLKV